MLLEWCTLEPSGSSNLAAVRFNSPVRVKTIRIFPTGTQPFAQCPDVVACVSTIVSERWPLTSPEQEDRAFCVLSQCLLQHPSDDAYGSRVATETHE